MSYHSLQVHERHDSASSIWYWYRNDSPTTDDVDLSRKEGETEGWLKEVSDKKQMRMWVEDGNGVEDVKK